MTTRQLKIASINAKRDHSVKGAVSDIERVIDTWHPPYIGIQEGSQYLSAYGKIPGYELAVPEGIINGARGNNPMLYDRKKLHQAHPASWLSAHAGRRHAYPERGIQVVPFIWIGGDRSLIWMNNTHLNSHIDVGGHPRPLPRVKLSSGHIDLLARTMKTDSRGFALAFGNGDFNVDEDADERVLWDGFPAATFKRHGITSIYEELHTPASFDTEGKRKIDNIISCNRDVRVTASKVDRIDTRQLVTDHSAVCGVYRIRLLGQ